MQINFIKKKTFFFVYNNIFFIINKNRVVSKNAIAEHLWGDDSDQMDSHDFIYVHLRNLRKKLMNKGCTDYVQTIYGIGYNFKTN